MSSLMTLLLELLASSPVDQSTAEGPCYILSIFSILNVDMSKFECDCA